MRSSVMKASALLVALAALGGCATLGTVESDVSTFASWPAQRAPGSYAFERLPSQQARAQEQAQLEATARPALEKAGFRLAADPASAEMNIQLGVRLTRIDQRFDDDPFGWRGGFFYGRGGRGGFWGPSLSFQFGTPRYEREVVVLVRDRASGQTLYEARAANDGTGEGNPQLLGAMFEAALKDFPNTGINPRRVSVTLPAAAPAPAASTPAK